MADISQIRLPSGDTFDLIDEKSGYITAQYIENKTDYSIPVSRAGEIIAGETAIGTDSTNFPTSKAVVDYVDERVVQEMDAIDVGVTGIKANGTSLSVVDGIVNIPVVGPNQSVGLITENILDEIYNNIPTSTSQLTNDSGYLTASDIASVMTYKGTKANYAALPSTGNTTGDVWHLTDTGAEWAWDGSAWQELGTAIDLSGYATKATTLAGYGITDAKIQNGTITLGSNSITPLTSFTETDPVFSASAAAGITSTDISNWNAKVSDDKTWNSKSLTMTWSTAVLDTYVPQFSSTSATGANLTKVSCTPSDWAIAKYDDGYLKSTTPSANDNSTKVATTAYVDGAVGGITVPTKTSDLTNDSGFITSYTDEKVKIVQVNDSNSHYLIFGNYSTTATTQLYDADLEYITTLSNNQNGYGRINLGNSKAQGTDGAKYGAIRFYGTTTYGVEIQGGAPTAWRAITLPDKNGTIALTSDIPQVYSSTNTGGYLTMATLPIYDGTVE